MTEGFEDGKGVGELSDQKEHLSRRRFVSLSNGQERFGEYELISLFSGDWEGFSSFVGFFRLCIGGGGSHVLSANT